jgi:hypothetical protein
LDACVVLTGQKSLGIALKIPRGKLFVLIERVSKMKTRTLKLSTLQAHGARQEQVDLFSSLFGEEVEISEAFALAHAQEFDWHWMGGRLLSPPYLEQFKEGEALLQEKFEDGVFLLREKYQEGFALLNKYQEGETLLLKEFEEGRDLLREKHKEGGDLLWEKRKKGEALLFCRLYVEDGEE